LKNIFYSAVIIVLVVTFQIIPQAKGHLVIIGGVQTQDIVKRYVALAGGPNARILIIPNAGSEPKQNSEEEQANFIKLGAKADYLLFTRETADDEVNLKKMEWANAVFFLGGDQVDLTRDMLGTKLLQKAYDIYNKGGVVGGSSAGAAVMSEVMITGNELVNKDSTVSFVTIERGNVEVKQGFGFIKSVIIDQHFLKRKRHNRTISTLIEHPNLIGVAIDESTSIIVNPDETFDVYGTNQVLVYDPTKSTDIRDNGRGRLGISNMKLDVLVSGDKYDLKSKQVIR
jgi:cyanophycinase